MRRPLHVPLPCRVPCGAARVGAPRRAAIPPGVLPGVLASVLAAALAAVVIAAPPGAVARPHARAHLRPLVALTPVSADPYTDSQAQHRTEVEPDTFAYGNTIMSAFQVGRVSGGGSSNIGYAVSTDKGATWSSGFLPGITGNAGGPYGQASDASVAYDARHSTWLVSELGVGSGVDVLVSRSTDGGTTWQDPVVAASGSLDKNWTACDNTATSPYYGNCYTEYDDPSTGDAEQMVTSTDGGATWSAPGQPADGATGLGGQPVVAPNGTVVVPYLGTDGSIRSFGSTDGGASWSASVLVSGVQHAEPAGGLREEPLPSAEIDAAGTVYLTWADCRFRPSCTGNDIVLSTSADGTTWSAPAQVPVDTTGGAADYFTPGIGVDAGSSGTTARIGLAYYYYPDAACTSCQLDVGYLSSTDGGTTWSTPTQVAGPMDLSWFPNTSQGRMFGDYISTSVTPGGNAFPVLPIALAANGSSYDEAMNVPTGGLPVGGGSRTATHRPAHAGTPRPAPHLPPAAR